MGLGGVSSQKCPNGDRAVAYASRSLSRNERIFTQTEFECLAVLFSLDEFRPYIEGVKVTVVTDHSSLLWLHNLKDPRGHLARWADALTQYDFEIIHRPGKDNVVPNFLSRSVENKVNDISNRQNLPLFVVISTIENDLKKNSKMKFKISGILV